MDTRQILQIVLGLIVLTIVGMTVYIILLVAKPTTASVVQEVVVEQGEAITPPNPWSLQGNAAIELVKSRRVTALAPKPEGEAKDDKKKSKRGKPAEPETVQVSVGELLERPGFVKDVLKLEAAEPVGWKVEWWGETKHGQTFYMVRYALKDAEIEIGPSWLVNLDPKKRKVVAKNALARAVMKPLEAEKDPYYDKREQVVAAIVAHRFEAGINLGGALLNYFEGRGQSAEGDAILGWTLEHDRGALYRAYFQWVESGQPTYAEFEFDYDAKGLKAVNLQAANVMREGEDFAKKERAKAMPESFDPSKPSKKQWVEGACSNRKLLRKRPAVRDQCKALATILSQREIVESLEWLLTSQVESSEAFVACQESRDCRWSAKESKEGIYNVSYLYKLEGQDERKVGWEVALKDEKVTPLDRTSTAAWRAIKPRD